MSRLFAVARHFTRHGALSPWRVKWWRKRGAMRFHFIILSSTTTGRRGCNKCATSANLRATALSPSCHGAEKIAEKIGDRFILMLGAVCIGAMWRCLHSATYAYMRLFVSVDSSHSSRAAERRVVGAVGRGKQNCIRRSGGAGARDLTISRASGIFAA
jgi:hypothetical protein